ncbi:polysaccharide biosynthesis protein GumN [Sphingobium sp. 22B]|uniref:TraB/GumN family protein n=1 Tax=unclassified Sphingobium TaxID=2611147 RepID=UPI00078559B0|nr:MULTISPECIES: TraB/GumN family protein [unclassified Sphingobium]KXU31401.1 polysaccharide biosynthesis protein GumN [Sphingobium sp. AM]KYC34291.1 polysaccharide biosynthesis protein GumN [Sphingobium sp. 22B]OAP33903.1 polysaccharide biosynthesis protein GumN [Sphingobium sp. 20006FA]
MIGLLARWLGLAVLCLIAACGENPPAPPPGGGPALWRVEGKGVDGWLFGTIHILPGGVEWRTGPIGEAIGRADRLVLESAGIQDQAGTLAQFERMGRSPGLPLLETRVPAGDKAALEEIVQNGGTNTQTLSAYEDWAAAMLLSAAAQQALHVSQDHGVEPALIAIFGKAGKPISGLETVERQFRAFDTLPPDAQRRLLVDTVREAKEMRRLYDHILNAWIRGDLATLARDGRLGETPDPVVEQAVLVDRNRDWVKSMETLKGRPFIAVGAGHLAGKDNLVDLLRAGGYRVTRMQ